LRCSDDLGSQESLLMSPQMYREMIKPYHREFFGAIHEHSDAKVFYHCCGAVAPLIDDFIDVGVDILNPVQVSCNGMDTAALKERFGDRISFCGAVDSQRVLPRGTIEDVRAETRRRIGDLSPGGGYLLAAVHNIQADVPPENIAAMYAAGEEFGHYPISV
jgi:uroporphyrinogen decarboxylase